MKFLLDHDVPAEVARVLAQAGHTVVCLKDVLPPDVEDNRVFDCAVSRELVLMTCNRNDFLRLAKNTLISDL